MTSKEMAMKAANTLLDKKGRDVLLIDISTKSSFADYFVLATGGSDRQVDTLVEEVEDRFSQEGIEPKGVEGKNGSGWVLMDFGDIIVNTFTQEQRERYNLEKVWGDCHQTLLDSEQ